MVQDPEILVRKANQLSSVDLLNIVQCHDLPKTNDHSVRIHLLSASEVPRNAQEALWTLFDENMGKLAAGTSLATSKGEKLEELFDPATRFAIYTSETSESPALELDNLEGHKLLGFASIRFDTEDTLDSQEYEDGIRAAVVYIYELQVASHARGLGLGRRLLSNCETLGKGTGMQKAMLTCLKKNGQALRFYMHNGYSPDEIDPTMLIQQEQSRKLRSSRGKTNQLNHWVNGEQADTKATSHIDYRILSKQLK
ncbi:hypothetical protein QFC19_001922 [Naganishia cerealis]|uniref:Uncharacterized protein n=1 Tax=Naganishia cerealis TaxID=610337 RepID=A0ACC2WF51_9TREE|nr:hypothetical protein QFC19_001922 [Naganishia cerealis]